MKQPLRVRRLWSTRSTSTSHCRPNKNGLSMNKYGTQIRERWTRTAPARTAELYDPETFFQDLGELVLARVNELSTSLPSAPAPDEDYLQTVGRLSSIQKQAEEIAMSELDWPEPELSLAEEREEWEATSTRPEALIEWAVSWESAPPEDELERVAAEWMLPADFLLQLATAPNPWTFSSEHSATISASSEQRFQRYLQGQ